MGNKIRINYLYSLSIFLIFPYTFDLFLLPSLQEKFTIPLFSYLLFKLEKAREEYKKTKVLNAQNVVEALKIVEEYKQKGLVQHAELTPRSERLHSTI